MIFVYSKISDGNIRKTENKKKYLKKIGIKQENVAEVKQVHSNTVLLINDPLNPNTEADGLITNNPDIYLMIKIADCMGIGFYDSNHQAIGLVHAGRKGLETGIIKKVIDSMKKNFDTNTQNLNVLISPSIGPCHYIIDLWTEAEKQLISFGILNENIHNPKICTYESKNYFSHRRSEDTKTPEGRFATILGLNNAN